MKKRKRNKRNTEDKLGPVVLYKPLEVTAKDCDGDVSKMIKKFCRKVRKEEVLKPYYRRLMYWETKSQKRRRQRLKSVYETKRRQNLEDIES